MSKTKLDETAFSTIHACILSSQNLHLAALELEVTRDALQCYLGKFLHNGTVLSYEVLKTIPAETLRDQYEEYDAPWKPKAIKIENYAFAYIHAAIIGSSTVSKAASRLGVNYRTLQRYLGKFSHNGAPLDYDVLKVISAEAMRAQYEEYDTPWQTTPIKLEDLAFANIHAAIIRSTSLNNAASCLGVTSDTLRAYIGKFVHNGVPLSYEALREILAKTLRDQYEEYDAPWKPQAIKIENYAFAYIHEAIIRSGSLNNAASRLGVPQNTLQRYLGKFLHNGVPLSYEVLNVISAEDLRVHYGERYGAPWKPQAIKLKNYAFVIIHAAVIENNCLNNAASRLGVSEQTLQSYLGKFLHNGVPLSYEILRTLSAETLRAQYGERYDSPWKPSPINLEDYAFSYIHEAIIGSVNQDEVATRFKVTEDTLTNYLQDFTIDNTPQGYESLKRLTPEEAHSILGPFYNKCSVNLMSSTLEWIHWQALRTANERELLTCLSMKGVIFDRIMGQFNLNYAKLKRYSPEALRQEWKEQYGYSLENILNVRNESARSPKRAAEEGLLEVSENSFLLFAKRPRLPFDSSPQSMDFQEEIENWQLSMRSGLPK